MRASTQWGEEYELLEDRGGPGTWRRGLGTTREIQFLDDVGYSLEGDGSVTAPPGLFEGAEGTPGAVVLRRPDGDVELPAKFPLPKGHSRTTPLLDRTVWRWLRRARVA